LRIGSETKRRWQKKNEKTLGCWMPREIHKKCGKKAILRYSSKADHCEIQFCCLSFSFDREVLD
jgi:hypothetical protein